MNHKSWPPPVRPVCNERYQKFRMAQSLFETEQAKEFVKMFVTMLNEGGGDTSMIYTHLADYPKSWNTPMWNYHGLLRRCVGVGPNSPCERGDLIAKKPAFYNYLDLIEHLDGYSSIEDIGSMYPPQGSERSYAGYKFDVNNKTKAVVWSYLSDSLDSSETFEVDLSKEFEDVSYVCRYEVVTEIGMNDTALEPIYPAPERLEVNKIPVSEILAIIIESPDSELKCPNTGDNSEGIKK